MYKFCMYYQEAVQSLYVYTTHKHNVWKPCFLLLYVGMEYDKALAVRRSTPVDTGGGPRVLLTYPQQGSVRLHFVNTQYYRLMVDAWNGNIKFRDDVAGDARK